MKKLLITLVILLGVQGSAFGFTVPEWWMIEEAFSRGGATGTKILTTETRIAAVEASATAAYASIIPAGTIQMYGSSTAPAGWLACNGAIASKSSYPGLYAAVGDTYNTGGETVNDFRLPDLRGVYAKGMGQNGILGANYANASGTPQLDTSQGHKHVLAYTHYAVTGTNSATAGTGSSGGGSTDLSLGANWTSQVTDGISGTPRVASITEPANVGVWYIIKY